MEKLKKQYRRIIAFTTEVGEDHIGAYAAQSAYFLMLSLIPMLLLLLTLVRYTPVTKADVMTAVIQVFPDAVNSMVTSIVNQVYNQSMAIIPLTAVVALWSAGKAVLSLNSGLNCIYDCRETRNYFYLRFRSTVYTVTFIMIILILLVLSVFGNTLRELIEQYIPVIGPLAEWVLKIQAIVSPIILLVFMQFIYTFLPNKRVRPAYQIPGSTFATLGWLMVTLFFSVYMEVFQGFSSMYGSLATIVLIMLWLYFCMYSILLGAEINVMYGEWLINKWYETDRIESYRNKKKNKSASNSKEEKLDIQEADD